MMPIVNERDRETARALIPCDPNACPFHWNSCRRTGNCDLHDEVATALTRARAEGVREGVERAIEAIEKCKLRPNSMLSGTGMAAVHDGALNDALRALADRPATTELDREG